MQNRVFTPFISFGNIKFGATRDEVVSLLNADYQEIRHNPEDKRFCDHYDTLGFKVEYGEDLTVISIETFNDMGFSVLFLEKNLTPLSFAKLERFFKKNDYEMKPYDIGFDVPNLGFTVCYTDFEEFPDEVTQSFCMVCKNYIDLPF
jgi:hypothetical protein